MSSHKLNYTWSQHRRSLVLNRGTSVLEGIDEANSLYSPLVELLEKYQPTTVTLVAHHLTSKMQWLICRSLFHSNLQSVLVRILWPQGPMHYEDFSYPLSKTFGEQLTCCRRRKIQGISLFDFKIERQLPRFLFEVGFYVISNGKDIDALIETLRSIRMSERISGEIVVVGPQALSSSGQLLKEFPTIQFISDEEIYKPGEVRFPISRKKNLILDQGRSEIVVILHDRIRLNPDWTNQLMARHRHFDLYTCVIESMDGRFRYLDKFSLDFQGYIQNRKSHFYMGYGEDNSRQMVDGGFFVLNRKSTGNVRFDPTLHWSEMEDVDFVLKLKLAGCLVSFDPENNAQSVQRGHFQLAKASLLSRFYKTRVRRQAWAWRLVEMMNFIRWRRSRGKPAGRSAGMKH